MCVNIINGETNNHTIQEKEQPKNKRIFAMDNSAVILGNTGSVAQLVEQRPFKP